MTQDKIRIMFVCLGNICRSPLAEYVFRKRAVEAGLEDRFDVESSGTGDWHVGQGADSRMQRKAAEYGIAMETHKAQQFESDDFEDFHHIFVMDKSNLHDVMYLDPNEDFSNKVRLFREFDPEPEDYQVPDPYHGGEQGFQRVYEIVDRTVRLLLERLIEEHELAPAR